MMNVLFPLVVRTHLSMQIGVERSALFVRDRIERSRKADDRGADLFEWAGMLILVAAIISALYGLKIVDKVKDNVDGALKDIFDKDPK
ncbi:hypothetical protein [Actinomadura rubrisoli]|uniref:Uncharacterized protein n=1 Tax=Actinomadura rubrisoli TaxID=2530368 RepID=A0A4R5AE72_9ACTN|nr:hypothetical protein [Actinomadura rubrisoli]TDD69419.1 hypothetical protein E1298_37480 [Actinomadura rubrisoli]